MLRKKDLELAKEALYHYEMLRLKHIESLPQVEFVPTEEFEEKMSELLNKSIEEPPIKKSLTKRQKIAILITATVVVALVVTACAFANKIKGFFINLFDSHAEAYSDNIEDYNFIQYELSWLPDNYQLNDSIFAKNVLKTIYSNDNKHIILIQNLNSNSSLVFDKENTDYEIRFIENIALYCQNIDDYYYVYWVKDDYSFYLKSPDTVEWTDIEKMISGVAIAEKQ